MDEAEIQLHLQLGINFMKKTLNMLLGVFLVFAALWSARTHFSYAYLDLGTGSYLFQMAAAGLFGALFVAKTFWTQIKTYITTKLTRRPAPERVE